MKAEDPITPATHITRKEVAANALVVIVRLRLSYEARSISISVETFFDG